ncbi:hypothetical protein [Asticcacaulis sp. EMRT-3]|uniref:hypothetical protein n=1 Tax=Asticcacaulis sp. EMRT-3 TaxID=3040349 RepID=UPI0024AEC565|nr:hypothetical protein [Asticcacaulis sp. EMRT-3]MDI7776475.1 hypothetical protein [Asticcacaulis sp. EMRT-3]
MMSSARSRYLAVLAAALCLAAGLAIAFGYISVDSWYYMLLARSLRDGHPLHLHHQYMAVYPLGYPLLLALTTPLARPEVMMITSKLANMALLAADFALIWRATRNLPVATLIVVNPVTLVIAMYTWSENLELFAICASLFLITNLAQDGKRRDLFLLAIVLIIGVFSRYFFGPLAFLIFAASWRVYGRKVAWRIFPAFCVAGLVYLSYQGVNWAVTGYPTGMPRGPAPEAPLLLIRDFLTAGGWNGLKVLIAAGLFLAFARRHVSLQRPARNDAATLILLTGLGFLALALVLRLRNYFDPFDTRTLGYGIVLTLTGLIGRYIHLDEGNQPVWPVAALIACALFSVVFADDFALLQDIHDLPDGYAFPAASLAQLKGHSPPANVIVSFQLPIAGLDSTNVDNINEVFYGPDVTVIAPLGGPDNTPESVPAFWHRLSALHPHTCYFDFTPFATAADFDTYLNAQNLIDRRWSWQDFRFHKVKMTALVPDMRVWLRHVFVAGRYLPCASALHR